MTCIRKGPYTAPEVPNHVHVNYISPEGMYIAPNNRWGIAEDSDWVAKHCKGDTQKARKCIAHNE